jgi:hypothetical protein
VAADQPAARRRHHRYRAHDAGFSYDEFGIPPTGRPTALAGWAANNALGEALGDVI